jgi:glycosyltransferase involved in cell wall biosynthesis
LKRIKIAYLTINDPLDKRSWSGITYYLGQSLVRHVGDVDFIGPVEFPRWIDVLLRGMAKVNRMVFRTEYATKYNLISSWYARRVFRRRMKGKQYDCIVAPAASTGVAYLDSRIPMVYVSDTTFRLISNYYKNEFERVSSFSRWEGDLLERRSLQRSSAIVYSSQWAADSAIRDYSIPGDRIVLMTLGANMDRVPDRGMIFEKEKNKRLTLLYLAVEWERKGGRIAFEALQALKRKGVDAELIVCGVVPPAEYSDPNMTVIPFLNKNKEEDHKKFIGLLSSVHFLILPTRADCSLLVACESNAYGVPAITTDTGGVSYVVRDGVNGYCLPYEAPGEAYADKIAELFADKERYHALVGTSRERFEETLNWDKWAEGFKRLYKEKILTQHK